MTLVLILALGGLMHAARSFHADDAIGGAGTLQSFGYLLLTAFFVGGLFKRIRLPRLTGYIATGIVAGPGVLNLVPQGAVESLQIISGIAIALIALTAGTELELRAMRPLFRSIAWITLVAVGGTTALLALTVFVCKPLLPFMAGMSVGQAAALSSVLAVVLVAQSPAVVVALRDEMAAEGPLARTVLGVVVIADLVVILLFAAVTTLVKSVFGARADVADATRLLAWELLGSVIAGVLVGAALAVYIGRIRRGAALFVLTMCFLAAEVGRRLHFDPLLVMLAAGIFIRNVTRVGPEIHREIEASSLPVYVVFFAVAGSAIHLDVLAVVGLPAVIFVVVRGAGFLVGGRLAAQIAGAPAVVKRFVGFGLLPQAGLALALAMLFAKTFPEFGDQASALTLGVVAINEIVAPALYRAALARSGEAGQLRRDEASETDVIAPPPPSVPPPAAQTGA